MVLDLGNSLNYGPGIAANLTKSTINTVKHVKQCENACEMLLHVPLSGIFEVGCKPSTVIKKSVINSFQKNTER